MKSNLQLQSLIGDPLIEKNEKLFFIQYANFERLSVGQWIATVVHAYDTYHNIRYCYDTRVIINQGRISSREQKKKQHDWLSDKH